MKSTFKWIFSLLLLCTVLNLNAQNDTVAAVQDTVQEVDFAQKIQELERQRFADSIRRADLETRIVSLKSYNNNERTELQQQLKTLNEKETILLEQKKQQIEQLKKTTKGYPVLGFFKDTLFLMHNRLGSFSPAERADAVTRRVKALPENLKFEADSLNLVESPTTYDITYGEQIIMSISDVDALWNDQSAFELAKSYRTIIGDAVTKYQDEANIFTLLKGIALALLVLLIIFFIIKYIIRFFRWTSIKIHQQEDKRIKGIVVKGYNVLDAKQQVNALTFVNKIVKWFTILIAIYIALPIIFGLFPWTRGFANTLFGYILDPVKSILVSFWNYLPNIITIVVIIIVFRFVLKGLNFIKTEVAEGRLTFNGFYPDWARPTYQLVRVLVIAFAIVVIFPYLPGSDSPIFQGISVFLGFLFTFGSAGSLSNVIAGLVLTYMRLFRIGDRVKIGDVVGDVIEKSSLVTRVRTTKNEIISIPNSTVMSSHTINYSSDAPEKGLIIHTTVTIGYDVPWKKMHQVLIDAALRTDLVLKEPQPFVLQTSLEDFYVAYQINAYVREANKQALIYSNLHQHIQDVCNEEGVEILSPHYRAARDGNQSTIPTDYLPKDYVAPSFNVKNTKPE